jgi:uroporphyrinogen decarboxylase
MSQTILETAYEMRGIEQLMIDFHDRPDYVECLFEKIAQQRLVQARYFVEAGVDILRIGDDIATQQSLLVSPQLYRDRIRPFHELIVALVKERDPGIQVLYHSDGNLTALLPQLIDIGVTAINPVQPECMDLVQIKREFGKHLTLWGCMPTQSVFPYGSREDVEQHIRFLMESVAPGGGLVVNFINTILTERVLDNLDFFNAAFYEMGRYRK